MPFGRRFYPKRLTLMRAYILRMGGPSRQGKEDEREKNKLNQHNKYEIIVIKSTTFQDAIPPLK